MRKLSVWLLLFCLIYPLSNAAAQGKHSSALKALRSGLTSNAGKFSRVAAREFFAHSVPLSETQFKTAEVIRKNLQAHGALESVRTAEQYRASLNKFLAIKKNLDAFLRYQKLEPQLLSRAEINARLAEANDALAALNEMERIVGARDPGVHMGKLYVEQVMVALKPTYAGYFAKKKQAELPGKFRESDSFNLDQFLLKDPNGRSLTMKNTMPGSEGYTNAQKMAAELPAMTIAVLNDDPEILEWARRWGSQGFFGRGSRVAVFKSLTDLMEKVKDVKYDVILMDYVLEDGISIFMIDHIRMAGDKSTVIMVNSALMDDEVPAKELFEHGADGFVSSVGFRADNGGARIANALYNYMQQHGRDALTPHSKK